MILIFGANRPVGQSLAVTLAEQGARVVLVDTQAEPLQAICAHNPDWIEAMPIANIPRDLQRQVSDVWGGQRIDLVLNLMPLDAGGNISEQMRNLTAVAQTTLRGLVAAKGCLVSVVARAGDPLGFVAHGMTAAVREASSALAQVVADKDVRVHCVTIPGGAEMAAEPIVRLLVSPPGRGLRSTVIDVSDQR